MNQLETKKLLKAKIHYFNRLRKLSVEQNEALLAEDVIALEAKINEKQQIIEKINVLSENLDCVNSYNIETKDLQVELDYIISKIKEIDDGNLKMARKLNDKILRSKESQLTKNKINKAYNNASVVGNSYFFDKKK